MIEKLTSRRHLSLPFPPGTEKFHKSFERPSFKQLQLVEETLRRRFDFTQVGGLNPRVGHCEIWVAFPLWIQWLEQGDKPATRIKCWDWPGLQFCSTGSLFDARRGIQPSIGDFSLVGVPVLISCAFVLPLKTGDQEASTLRDDWGQTVVGVGKQPSKQHCS